MSAVLGVQVVEALVRIAERLIEHHDAGRRMVRLDQIAAADELRTLRRAVARSRRKRVPRGT